MVKLTSSDTCCLYSGLLLLWQPYYSELLTNFLELEFRMHFITKQ